MVEAAQQRDGDEGGDLCPDRDPHAVPGDVGFDSSAGTLRVVAVCGGEDGAEAGEGEGGEDDAGCGYGGGEEPLAELAVPVVDVHVGEEDEELQEEGGGLESEEGAAHSEPGGELGDHVVSFPLARWTVVAERGRRKGVGFFLKPILVGLTSPRNVPPIPGTLIAPLPVPIPTASCRRGPAATPNHRWLRSCHDLPREAA